MFWQCMDVLVCWKSPIISRMGRKTTHISINTDGNRVQKRGCWQYQGEQTREGKQTTRGSHKTVHDGPATMNNQRPKRTYSSEYCLQESLNVHKSYHNKQSKQLLVTSSLGWRLPFCERLNDEDQEFWIIKSLSGPHARKWLCPQHDELMNKMPKEQGE